MHPFLQTSSSCRSALAAILLPLVLTACGGGDDGNSGVAPQITTQPLALTGLVGESVQFSVAASGTPAPAIAWLLDGTTLADGPLAAGRRAGATVSGAATATVTLAAWPQAWTTAPRCAAASNGSTPDALSNEVTLTVHFTAPGADGAGRPPRRCAGRGQLQRAGRRPPGTDDPVAGEHRRRRALERRSRRHRHAVHDRGHLGRRQRQARVRDALQRARQHRQQRRAADGRRDHAGHAHARGRQPGRPGSVDGAGRPRASTSRPPWPRCGRHRLRGRHAQSHHPQDHARRRGRHAGRRRGRPRQQRRHRMPPRASTTDGAGRGRGRQHRRRRHRQPHDPPHHARRNGEHRGRRGRAVRQRRWRGGRGALRQPRGAGLRRRGPAGGGRCRQLHRCASWAPTAR